jgi:hypothetical protein
LVLISSISILEVVAQHFDNPNYLYHLSLFKLPLGDLLFAEGDVNGAVVRWRAAADVLERLVARDPANAEWRKGLDAALGRIDDARKPAGPTPARQNGRNLEETTSRAAARDGWIRRTLARWFSGR